MKGLDGSGRSVDTADRQVAVVDVRAGVDTRATGT